MIRPNRIQQTENQKNILHANLSKINIFNGIVVCSGPRSSMDGIINSFYCVSQCNALNYKSIYI